MSGLFCNGLVLGQGITEVLGSLFILAIIGIFALAIALPLLLSHKQKMARLHAESQGGEESLAKEVAALTERCGRLEARCGELERQVRTAHELLADEQRALDRKLTAILPDADAAPANKTIGPQDETRAAQRS
ncbi:MAG: hypothetical protein L6R28_14470 [Planctomycetes bacterium]|nr:hypothetical protein [Planctomycetota bacterium]